MTIQLFDLCGRDDALRFSPYCWRTKMALHHKGLDYQGLPWRFTEKERLSASGQERVPVLVDGDRIVSDSWKIALYLDEAYPDRPALMHGAGAKASARLTNVWADTTLFGPIVPLAVKAVHDILDPADGDYFRSSREQRLGKPLEEAASEEARAAARVALSRALTPVETTLADHAFLGGDAPYYGDYAVFGTLMWPHVVAPEAVLDPESATSAWFDRMMDLFDGAARKAPTVRS